VLTFSLTVYEGYFREHKYGLLNQTFGPWRWGQVIALAVSLILGGILLAPLVEASRTGVGIPKLSSSHKPNAKIDRAIQNNKPRRKLEVL
jgi:hypothetical protein